jgi:hypothetical protein
MAERGRPSIFSEELATRICERLALGETLRSVCRDDDMPSHTTVLDWAKEQPFSDQYARAREAGYGLMADEILEIADDGRNDKFSDDEGHVTVDHDVIARSRLRVDTRKWLLSKALPKVYGDKQQIDVNARVEIAGLLDEARERVKNARA